MKPMPCWDPREKVNPVYERVHVHSPGMISFAFEPHSPDAVDRIRAEARKTEAFQFLQTFRSNGDTPSNR